MSVNASTKRTDVQFKQVANVLKEAPYSGSKLGMVPGVVAARPQLKVIHILETRTCSFTQFSLGSLLILQ